MNSRHTVGGAHSVVTPQPADGSEQALGVEPGLVDHEHGRAGIPWREQAAPGVLGPPGEEMFRWMSPGSSPSQYMVDSPPTG